MNMNGLAEVYWVSLMIVILISLSSFDCMDLEFLNQRFKLIYKGISIENIMRCWNLSLLWTQSVFENEMLD